MKYFWWISCLIGGALSTCIDAQANPFQKSDFFNDINDNRWTIQLESGYTMGKFIGLEENYVELGVFVAPESINGLQPLVDLRGFRLDNGDWAASVGIGTRWWDRSSFRVYGTNLFYDYRNAHFANFHRIGIGLESLGECLDYRLNVYLPVNGDTKHSSLHVFDKFTSGFIATCQEHEFAFKGVDFELGWHIWHSCNFSLYGSTGPYYYHNKRVSGIFGGQAHLELSWVSCLTLEVRVSYDKKFDTHVQGKIMLSLPLYELYCGRQDDSCQELITQGVKRNNVPFTTRCCDWTWNW